MNARTGAQISQRYVPALDDYYLDIEHYLFFSAAAMSCYDYLLTLDREIEFIWKANLSFATILFYSYRYPILLYAVIEILGRSAWGWQSVEVRGFDVMEVQLKETTASCRAIQWAQMGLDWIVKLSSAIFASLRVYAMYGRCKWLFVVVLFIGLLSPTIWLYIFTITSPIQDRPPSCSMAIHGSPATYEDLVMGARAASLLSDGIVLVLTCMKTVRRDAMKTMILADRVPTLGDILLKDTAICFIFLCIINVLALAIGRIPSSIVMCSVWTALLSSILPSRLALDLREVHAAEADGEIDLLSHTLRFRHEDDSSYIDLDSYRHSG